MSKIFYLCLLVTIADILKVNSLTCGERSSDKVATRPMENCLFLNDTRPLIQCDIYGVGNLTEKYVKNILSTLLMRVTFDVNGPAQVDDNSNSWCLSIRTIELKIVYDRPPNAQIYGLKNELPRLFSAITEFQVIANIPPEHSKNDAFTELPSSCNINARTDDCKMGQNGVTFLLKHRYDEIVNLSQIKEEFLVKRQATVKYFRFLLASRITDSSLFSELKDCNIKIIDLSGNDLRPVFEGDEIPSLPNATHLLLSQGSIKYFRPENFEKFENLEVLDLSENNLRSIPPGLETLEKLKELNLIYQRTDSFDLKFNHTTSIEKLYLDKLPITKLSNATFSWLPKLRYLSLRSCTINSIEENTFYDLKYLKYLDLSYNKNLKRIFPDTFLYLTPSASITIANNPQLNLSLTVLHFRDINMLDLTNCGLTSLPHPASGNIENLNLSSNSISTLENGESNHKISRLNISYNKIASINSKMGDFLSKLELVDIGGNPFNCENCDLIHFRQFLNSSFKIVQNLGTYSNITCMYPVEEEGKEILNTIYICYSKWLTIGAPVACPLLILSILLVALGFIYRFELIYTKQMWRMKRRNEKRSIRRTVRSEFDAFVSYCAADRAWVMDKLVPTLEPPVGQYTLCLHERDFRLGSYIMDNIVENIEKSRRVLFVLSNSFLDSEWCKWELRMATHRIFERSASDFLVLLELERLQRERVPLSLRVLLATRTYLEWHQNQPEVFWSRLKQTLGKPLSRPIQEPEESLNKEVDDLMETLEMMKKDPEILEQFTSDPL